MSEAGGRPSRPRGGSGRERACRGGHPRGRGRPGGQELRARRGILSVGIATTGVVTFAYFAVASHVLPEVEYKAHLAAVVGDVRGDLDHLPADRAAALAHDRRAPGAGPRAAPATRARHDPGELRVLFPSVALALRARSSDDVFDGSSALYWVLVVGTLAYAASYFARGWLAGHQRFALYGGLVFLESTSRFLFALAVAVGITSGQGASRWASPRRRSSRSWSCRAAFSRRKSEPDRGERPSGPSRETRAVSDVARHGLRGQRARRSCSPSRPCSTRRSSPPTSPPPTPRWPASCSTSC